jgi:putative transposase
MSSPAGRRQALATMTSRGVSERAACRHLGLSRRVAGYALNQPAKDRALGKALIATSQRFPRFGYRRIAAWLNAGLFKVRRLWRQLHLQLPRRRPRRRRCGNDIRLPGATRKNSVWTYDFVHDRLADGRAIRLLIMLDEHTRECLAIEAARSITSQEVILTLSRLMKLHGKPEHIRSDHGAEFTSGVVMRWLRDERVGPAFTAPGRPWQNAFVESFNGKLRDECLNREWFKTGHEAKIIVERWRRFYNEERPHSALGYRTPAQARLEGFKIAHRLTV